MNVFRRLGTWGLALLILGWMTGAAPGQDDDDWQIPVTLGKDGWMLYENGRFGMLIPVPPGMKAMRPPDNGGGQRFETADGRVALTCWGSFNVDGSGDPDARWKAALAEPGRTITYKVRKADWYVVSGVTDEGVGFYERYQANDKYCAGWVITHPQADEAKYRPWIERIARGFEARLGKGADTID